MRSIKLHTHSLLCICYRLWFLGQVNTLFSITTHSGILGEPQADQPVHRAMSRTSNKLAALLRLVTRLFKLRAILEYIDYTLNPSLLKPKFCLNPKSTYTHTNPQTFAVITVNKSKHALTNTTLCFLKSSQLWLLYHFH